MDILALMAKAWPDEVWGLVHRVGAVAGDSGLSLYLVGGAVRDLLLGRPSLDLDLVVERDALSLLPRLRWEGHITTHPRFGTAKLEGKGWSLDLASARAESYPHPGALPRVRPGTLQEDLFRRDFSINAIAVRLSAPYLGEIIDPFHGREDLERGLVRVLHEKSFQDDPTRLLRAVRYAARFAFSLEEETERLTKRDKGYLSAVSGDRVRRELGLILKEERPEAALSLAGRLGLLGEISPSLEGDGWLEKSFARAREEGHASPDLYLALLAFRLPPVELLALIQRLNFPGTQARLLQDIPALKEKGKALSQPQPPSQLYQLLHGLSLTALRAMALASPSPIKENLSLYLDKLRYVKLYLKGGDLKRLGVEEGPRVGEYLRRLLETRLDGEVSTRAQEIALVRQWLATGRGP